MTLTLVRVVSDAKGHHLFQLAFFFVELCFFCLGARVHLIYNLKMKLFVKETQKKF